MLLGISLVAPELPFYLADGFPESYYGSVFTGEVAGNLVHRDVFTALASTPSFSTSRAIEETDREFLASTDPWFRPANFSVGPDGYLYVVDMYRQHIETPLSIPEDLKMDMDFDAGKGPGQDLPYSSPGLFINPPN